MNSSLRSLRALPKSLALLLLLAGCFHAPPQPGLRMQGVKLPLDAYRLPSGMQVIIEEDHASPVVGVVAVVAAGNADDPVGKEGLAHLVEHLTYRARPDGKLQRRALLDFAAAGDVNATTDPDDTVYWAFGPARSLEGLIRIEANRLADPLAHLDAATFEVERNVVLNELAQGDPGQRSCASSPARARAADVPRLARWDCGPRTGRVPSSAPPPRPPTSSIPWRRRAP